MSSKSANDYQLVKGVWWYFPLIQSRRNGRIHFRLVDGNYSRNSFLLHARTIILLRIKESRQQWQWMVYCDWRKRKVFARKFEHSNCTIVVHLDNISGSFSLATGNLAWLRLTAKVQTMARPNSPDLPPECNKMVQFCYANNRGLPLRQFLSKVGYLSDVQMDQQTQPV